MLLKLALAGILLASALSHAGALVEPLDLLSHFRPFYAVACLGLAIPLLIWRQRASAAVALLLFAANLAGVLSYPRAPTDDRAQGGALTVLTANLWGANGDPQKVHDLISRAKPDIVLLQELSPRRLGLLERLAADYPWQTHCAHNRRCRVAVLSKHPWQSATARIVFPGALPLVRAEFGPGLGNLLVVNAHLTRPYQGSQRLQLATVKRAIEGWTGPVLLGGDFNATPWSWTLRRFARETRLRTAGASRPSWPRRLMLAGRVVRFPVLPFPLDQIWLSGDAVVVSSERGADVGSDHMPLIVRLSLPDHPVLVSRAASDERCRRNPTNARDPTNGQKFDPFIWLKPRCLDYTEVVSVSYGRAGCAKSNSRVAPVAANPRGPGISVCDGGRRRSASAVADLPAMSHGVHRQTALAR